MSLVDGNAFDRLIPAAYYHAEYSLVGARRCNRPDTQPSRERSASIG